nr:12626_t:CDS:2 [Entrophospora candida]
MTFLAFGKHTVFNLINSPYFTFKKIFLRTEHHQDKGLLQLLAKRQIPYQLLSKEQFSRYNFDKKNQGIVAFIRNYVYAELPPLLSCQPQRKFPLLVMLDSIEDPHNFGAILRTCAALKVDGVIIAKKNQVPVNSTVVKVSMGGVAYVPVCQVNSLGETINESKKKGYKIISTSYEDSWAEHQNYKPTEATYRRDISLQHLPTAKDEAEWLRDKLAFGSVGQSPITFVYPYANEYKPFSWVVDSPYVIRNQVGSSTKTINIPLFFVGYNSSTPADLDKHFRPLDIVQVKNCEHFANMLVYGINFSQQVREREGELTAKTIIQSTGIGIYGGATISASIAFAPFTFGLSLIPGAVATAATVSMTADQIENHATLNNGKTSICLSNEIRETNDRLGEKSD